MSFKYINPGYASLLAGADSQIQHSDSQYSNIGLYLASDDFINIQLNNYNIDISTLSDLWVRFDLYIPTFNFTDNEEYYREFQIILPNADDYYSMMSINVFGGQFEEPFLYFFQASITGPCSDASDFTVNGENATTDTALAEIKSQTGLTLGAINKIWVHFHFDLSSTKYNVECNLKINNKLLSINKKTTANGKFKNSLDNFVFYTYGSQELCLSNIIISDEFIDHNEKIVPLIVSDTKTTMTTLEGGMYRAERAGQKVLQSADVFSLSDIYGADSRVTGIFLVGYPAYADSGSETLTAISTLDSDVTTHGAYNITDNSDTLIFSSWITSTDMTIADLNGFSFGWRAGV